MIVQYPTHLTPPSPSLAEKRKKALEFLGERWVLHPNYKFDPHHSMIRNLRPTYVSRKLRTTD